MQRRRFHRFVRHYKQAGSRPVGQSRPSYACAVCIFLRFDIPVFKLLRYRTVIYAKLRACVPIYIIFLRAVAVIHQVFKLLRHGHFHTYAGNIAYLPVGFRSKRLIHFHLPVAVYRIVQNFFAIYRINPARHMDPDRIFPFDYGNTVLIRYKMILRILHLLCKRRIVIDLCAVKIGYGAV